MTVKPIFAWYDLWIGAFWDQAKRRLYVFPFPMLGVVIQFAPARSATTRALDTSPPGTEGRSPEVDQDGSLRPLVGDGFTDSTEALQQRLDLASGLPGEVNQDLQAIREGVERAGLWANLPANRSIGRMEPLDAFEAGKRAATDAILSALYHPMKGEGVHSASGSVPTERTSP